MPTLALLDGHNLAFRAFYALPSDLATPSGQVTNAVYGFTSMIIKLLDDEHPDAIAVAWDTPAVTFRKERYEEYKAQREAAPDLFRSQLPLIREVSDALRLAQFEAPGWEADDLIATIARRAAEAGWEVLIVTGDRDTFQLVGGSVRVYYVRRGVTDIVIADAAYVTERYGVTPEQYPDYAALRGDSSDNLPGVPGVGEKTASRLIAGYGGLEGLYDHLEEQTPRLRENLEAFRAQVFLNRDLTRLVDDVSIETDVESLRLQPWDPQEVRRVFDALAFRSLWQRLKEIGGGGESVAAEVLDVTVGTGSGEDAVAGAGDGMLAIDPVWEGGDLIGLAVASPSGATFVPFDRLGTLAAALADPGIPKGLHDAKPVMRALFESDLDLRGLAFDSALAAYVVNPAGGMPDLGDLAGRVLGIEIDADVAGERAAPQGTLAFETAGPDLEGAGRRAVAVARLVEPLTAELEARGGSALFREVELPLVRVLARMEDAGILVDRDYLEELGESLRDRLATLERQIYQAAGEPFNINSTLQLREILFDRLKLPVLKKTPKGQPSTDASVLQKLVEEHPVVEHLLGYRELEKLRSTYVDGLLPLIGPDGRIHCSFNQTGAATGRISSEQPNMQNIPVRSEEGRTIRRAFIAAPGHTFVVADYSQIELRILAHLSGDPGLGEAFAAGEDIHSTTAARVFGVDRGAVTADMRRMAKVINFGLLYGMESYGLGQRLEIGAEEAKTHLNAYFAQFPAVREFMTGIVAEARNTGYTETILGRRRYLPELTSGNFRERQAGERMALNAPIQGSAADIIKKAMVRLDAELETGERGGTMLLQVHDELVVEAPLGEEQATVELVREVMEGIVSLDVPLVVDIGTGRSLADAKG
ncbi:MAG: DNA polymerase I [Actinobacteria bacterium RBG_16_68_21]|nr:MAG: DNA polymerase I [Actinobacteria bacterium RBG_16_68_21]